MAFDEPSYVELAAGRIAYRESGAGEPLLFIHGYPLSSLTWRKVIPDLERCYRCIAVDLMGAGYTDVPSDADLSIEGQAKMLSAFIDAIDLPAVTLIAHDSGAVIARLLAAQQPGRVRRLIIFDTEVPGHIVPSVVRAQRLARLPGVLRLVEAFGPSRRLILSMIGKPFATPEAVDFGEFVSTVLNPLRRSRRLFRASLKYAVVHDLRFVDALPHELLTMPKLVLWGEHDSPLLLLWGRELFDLLPEPKSFVVMEKCGILPHEECPQAWIDAVVAYLVA